MKKTLGSLVFFTMLTWLIFIVVAPFFNPWFFLLAIPFPFVMPHIDSIAGWCFKTMDGK